MTGLLFLIALLLFLSYALWKMLRRSKMADSLPGAFQKRVAGESLTAPLVRAVTEACASDGRYYRILLNAVIPKDHGVERFDLLLFHETGIYAFERHTLLKQQRNVTAVLQKFLDPTATEFFAFDFLLPKTKSTISPKEILDFERELEQMLCVGKSVCSSEQIDAWIEKIQ